MANQRSSEPSCWHLPDDPEKDPKINGCRAGDLRKMAGFAFLKQTYTPRIRTTNNPKHIQPKIHVANLNPTLVTPSFFSYTTIYCKNTTCSNTVRRKKTHRNFVGILSWEISESTREGTPRQSPAWWRQKGLVVGRREVSQPLIRVTMAVWSCDELCVSHLEHKYIRNNTRICKFINHLLMTVNIIIWVVPLPSNSHHQEYNIFRSGSL